ncbi:MAG: hypothetical protein GWN58_45310, partial [Anaerolineae bacterium]|nr:hypothetical protein [Anaerolineae bacterium]
DYAKAVETLDKGMQFVREWSLTYLSPFIMGFLGHACALACDTSRGMELLAQANRDYVSLGLGLFRSLIRIQLGEAQLLAGDTVSARDTLRQGLAL